MELDELKKQWQQIELRIDKVEEANHRLTERLKKNKATNAKQRLTTQFGVKLLFCIISPLWMVLFASQVEVRTELYISYMVFFVIMAISMAYVWNKLRTMNYMKMSIKEALIAVYDMERLYRRVGWVGIITGAPLIVFMLMEIHKLEIPEAVYGAWVGLIVGAIVGLISKIRYRRLLKEMRQALEEEIGDDENSISD